MRAILLSIVIALMMTLVPIHSAPEDNPGSFSGGTTIILPTGIPLIVGTPMVNNNTTGNVAIDVMTVVNFTVSVTDPDTLDDIKRVTINLYVSGSDSVDDKRYRMSFNYTDNGTGTDDLIVGNFTQIAPTLGDYDAGLTGTAPPSSEADSSGTGNFSFYVTFDKLARETTWNFDASVEDYAGNIRTASSTFKITPYLRLDNQTLGSGLSFNGSLATPIETFWMNVTSNGQYRLEINESGEFFKWTDNNNYSWNPEFNIKELLTGISMEIPTSGVVQWWSSADAVIEYEATGHRVYIMNIDNSTGLPGGDYTGPTIDVTITNDP